MAENRDYHPFKVISAVTEFPNEYLDYFSPTDITDRIRHAVKLYSGSKVNPEQVFLTIDKPRQERLIAEMQEIILTELKKHNII